jgi:hypothetical protein
MARRLVKRTEGHYYLDSDEDHSYYNHEEPYGVRLVLRSDRSYEFVPISRRDPWWNQRLDSRKMRPMVYKAGAYVEVIVAHHTFWLGRIAPDPEGKDYVGTEFARVILDGNEVSEQSYKSGMRPLSLLEVLAWASA